MKNALFLALGIGLIVAGCSQPAADAGTSGSATGSTTGGTPAPADDKFAATIRPMFVKNCGQCHTGGGAKGGFNLENINTTEDLKNPTNVTILTKVAEVISTKKMPPPNAPQPTDEDRMTMAEGLKAE